MNNDIKKLIKSFAYAEFSDSYIYSELSKNEKNQNFKNILITLSKQEKEHYKFWSKFIEKSDFSIPKWKILSFKLIRYIFGLIFIAKYLEIEEKNTINEYINIMNYLENHDKNALAKIIEEEKIHEKEFISQIPEDKIKFTSSIVLGINDGLIELSGALTGFTFALKNHMLIAITGLITGIAAALSMSASSYMQAKHEEGKDANKAAFYTGLSYLIVVLLLITPFIIIPHNLFALSIMALIIILIILSLSLYTSVLLDKAFKRQFLEILTFSIGVAIIAFILGTIFRKLIGFDPQY